jgi:hypothetical protein
MQQICGFLLTGRSSLRARHEIKYLAPVCFRSFKFRKHIGSVAITNVSFWQSSSPSEFKSCRVRHEINSLTT